MYVHNSTRGLGKKKKLSSFLMPPPTSMLLLLVVLLPSSLSPLARAAYMAKKRRRRALTKREGGDPHNGHWPRRNSSLSSSSSFSTHAPGHKLLWRPQQQPQREHDNDNDTEDDNNCSSRTNNNNDATDAIIPYGLLSYASSVKTWGPPHNSSTLLLRSKKRALDFYLQRCRARCDDLCCLCQRPRCLVFSLSSDHLGSGLSGGLGLGGHSTLELLGKTDVLTGKIRERGL